MFTVSRGDWRKPIYAQESREDFYAALRKPLERAHEDDRIAADTAAANDRADKTTENLTADLASTGHLTAKHVLHGAMRSEKKMTAGALRTAWSWGLGYVLRERMADWRVGLPLGTIAVELTSSYEWFEVLRQEMLEHEVAADEIVEKELQKQQDEKACRGAREARADARRAMVEYYNGRVHQRVQGLGNDPLVQYERDGLATLTAGGSWVGCYELSTLAYPELTAKYQRIHPLDKVAAMANAVASLPRDQREGTKNALIPVYNGSAARLERDMAGLCAYIGEDAGGPELAMVGHQIGVTNIHSRYSMFAVFLAALRLGGVSLTDSSPLRSMWAERAVRCAEKMTTVPEGCKLTSQADRKPLIEEAVDRLWASVVRASAAGTDEALADAQRSLHRFVDEEAQGTCWGEKDPAVLWGVCAAMFWTMMAVEGMAGWLLAGDDFKALYVRTEGYEEEWLREIYASRA